MSRLGTYYIARVLKQGLKSEDIIDAMVNPVDIEVNDFTWSFSDYEIQNGPNNEKIHFARLIKYVPEGLVPSLDKEEHKTINQITEEMIIASSPFVYIPEYSGIGFLHIWNKIEEQTFRRRFEDIIMKKMDYFFIDCKLEIITDLKNFIKKLDEFEHIERIYAKVKPPNPSFGWLWKDLNDYLKRRNTTELTIDEKGGKDFISKLKKIIKILLESENIEDNDIQIDIGDAAVLMAADGYGRGKIEGVTKNQRVMISTKDKAIVLKLPVDAAPIELYEAVQKKLRSISDERYMGH